MQQIALVEMGELVRLPKVRKSSEKRPKGKGAQLLLFPTRRLPLFREECAGDADARMAGDTVCTRYTCRHNLIGEMANLEPKRALRVAMARLEGKITASCALDVAGAGGATDREIAKMFGMGGAAFREMAEAAEERLANVIET